jgi:hypothetical protein
MRHRILIMALMTGSCLMASQGLRLNGGVQAGFAVPVGDFADKEDNYGEYLGANNGIGLHVGGHFDLNFTDHHQLRLHLTGHSFASEKQDRIHDGAHANETRQNTFGVAQIGGDYVFNVSSPVRGGYFFGGVSINSVHATAEFSDSPDVDISQSGREGIRLGGGYNFNRVFSLEGQYNSVSVKSNGEDGFGFSSLSWVSVSAVFRFGRP